MSVLSKPKTTYNSSMQRNCIRRFRRVRPMLSYTTTEAIRFCCDLFLGLFLDCTLERYALGVRLGRTTPMCSSGRIIRIIARDAPSSRALLPPDDTGTFLAPDDTARNSLPSVDTKMKPTNRLLHSCTNSRRGCLHERTKIN